MDFSPSSKTRFTAISLATKAVFFLSFLAAESYGTNNGVFTGVSTRMRFEPVLMNTDGGPGEISASTSLSNNSGDSLAMGKLSGSLFLPELSVQSNVSDDDNVIARVTSIARSQMQYRYDGPATTTVVLRSNLTGEDTNSGPGQDSLTADVVVLPALTEASTDLLATDSVTPGASHVDEFVFGTPGFGPIKRGLLEITHYEVGPRVKSRIMTLGLSPGDVFYVWAELFASATSGTVEGLNGLTMNFSDPTNITPIHLLIPEPTTSTLALAALCLAMGGRRK